ncbi:MAG: C-terminal helicase domain-containing protein, partial [Actinomycetota bacterium]|nr:C-terminal helicase domain-containing protein [Actinomycetota bacterium]
GHRALVFSQFVRHLALVRERLDAAGVAYRYLDGSTAELQRRKEVDAFQRGEGDVFLISLKAGGTGLNLTGADYVIPGFYLSLVPTDITFTVGLGGDELGYWVPIAEARLKCLDLVIPVEIGYTCQRLFDEGLLVTIDAVAGPICQSISRDGDLPPLTTEQLTALAAVCRYGQALGRELGEPDGHYEETNSAGWDLVDDTWAAAVQLFGE